MIYIFLEGIFGNIFSFFQWMKPLECYQFQGGVPLFWMEGGSCTVVKIASALILIIEKKKSLSPCYHPQLCALRWNTTLRSTELRGKSYLGDRGICLVGQGKQQKHYHMHFIFTGKWTRFFVWKKQKK